MQVQVQPRCRPPRPRGDGLAAGSRSGSHHPPVRAEPEHQPGTVGKIKRSQRAHWRCSLHAGRERLCGRDAARSQSVAVLSDRHSGPRAVDLLPTGGSKRCRQAPFLVRQPRLACPFASDPDGNLCAERPASRAAAAQPMAERHSQSPRKFNPPRQAGRRGWQPVSCCRYKPGKLPSRCHPRRGQLGRRKAR